MKNTCLLIAFLLSAVLLAQESAEGEYRDELGPNRLSIMLGHVTVPTGINVEGKEATLILPMYGILYDRYFSENFALGIHADIFLQQFEIELDKGAGEIERSYPITLALIGQYRLYKGLWLEIGGGIELERNRNFAVYNIGLEYGWELPKSWEIAVSASFDRKWDGYSNFIFGVVAGKRF